MPTLAVIQESPVVLDRQQTLAKSVLLINKAAAAGADTLLFPEAFVPGYPAWIWRLRPGGDWGLSEELHSRLHANAVSLARDDLAPVMEAARANKVTVILGINECDDDGSRSTLYNSVVTIGSDGTLLNHHRKLMPTNPERMVWGAGDARGLNVYDTPVGRTGALICWENFMPLSRFALYAEGVEVYLAPTYDSGDGWVGTMQHIAREGRCWVASCGVALEYADLPSDMPDKDRLYSPEDSWINPGDSVIVAPGGDVVAGPLNKQKGMLLADIVPGKAVDSRRALDVAGHYGRPDIFRLEVDRSARRASYFRDG